MTLKEILNKFTQTLIEKLNSLQQSIPNSAYSDLENLTGGTWVNGKPIYRRVLSGSVTDILTLLLISEDVDEICMHSGTGNLGSGSGYGIALPNYTTTAVNLSIGEIVQEDRFYGFQGASKPTHLSVSSFIRKTTLSGGELFPLSMNFKIVIEYTKIGSGNPEPILDEEWIDDNEWLDEEEYIG